MIICHNLKLNFRRLQDDVFLPTRNQNHVLKYLRNIFYFNSFVGITTIFFNPDQDLQYRRIRNL